ncbi:copper chaperone PCu(A)C [Actinomadura sp. ATCC 31491]|uniref:Copper chaperone PCu(A)C n=1 Tax=Actinomadura luzonensis TaxID=2805427 RepID=A0ABT0FSX5_9ACTN|nr:copper chaperone PCu(A)C [Actinomadura luzonensis]MCK2214981.1 copper chaperone PCu(A)C [Actinomadura luzonensis]
MTSRRWIAAAAAFLIAPVLAGCGAGFDATTNKPYAPNEAQALIENGSYGSRGIHIPQAFILGPDSGAQLPWRGSAPIYLNILNTTGTPDTLQAVSAGTMGTVKVTAPVQIPSNQLVNTGKPTPQLMLESISRSLRGGETVKLDLQFANAGIVSLNVPVVTRSREFAEYPAAPGATPAPTPTPSASAPAEEAH